MLCTCSPSPTGVSHPLISPIRSPCRSIHSSYLLDQVMAIFCVYDHHLSSPFTLLSELHELFFPVGMHKASPSLKLLVYSKLCQCAFGFAYLVPKLFVSLTFTCGFRYRNGGRERLRCGWGFSKPRSMDGLYV